MIPDSLARKLVLFALPLGVMTGVLVGLAGLTPGLDQSLGTLGKTAAQQQILRAGGEKGSGTVDAVLEVEATIEDK